MITREFYKFIKYLDSRDVFIFTIHDVRNWFREKEPTLKKGLARHLADGLIVRLARGLYANAMPSCRPLHSNATIVPYLRPCDFNYESFESRLNSLGVISQIPTRLTMATTGRSGLFVTPLGTIEFTHVPLDLFNKSEADFRWDEYRAIWLASPQKAYDDSIRHRRSLELIDEDGLKEATLGYFQDFQEIRFF
jgi:hypothetical protein